MSRGVDTGCASVSSAYLCGTALQINKGKQRAPGPVRGALPASYPPVDEVAEWLRGIRTKRVSSRAKELRWFLDLASRRGLPAGAEVDVVGAGTDTLSSGTNWRRDIHFRGWFSATRRASRESGVRAVSAAWRDHLSAHNRQRSAGPIVHADPREPDLDRLDLGATRSGRQL